MVLPPEAIIRLNLGHIWLGEYPLEIPVHGFLIKHPDGAGLVDTGYGKLAAFHEAWTRRSSVARAAASRDDAAQIADALLSRAPLAAPRT